MRSEAELRLLAEFHDERLASTLTAELGTLRNYTPELMFTCPRRIQSVYSGG